VLVNECFARQTRRQRLFHHHDERLLVVPLDHGIGSGPIVHDRQLDRLVGQIHEGGADAVVLHKGVLRHISTRWFRDMSAIVHLSASTIRSVDPDSKYLVSTVEEALRLGADGVSVHTNIGSRTEERQITDLAAVADACDRWGMPLLAMVYPRGPHIVDGHERDLVAHAVTLAADLGADLIKTYYPGSAEAMADVTGRCPVPVLVAGGPVGESAAELFQQIGDALRGGAAGAAVGRHVFHAADPADMTRRLADLVHRRPPLEMNRRNPS